MCELFAMSASVPHTVCYELDLFAAEGGEKDKLDSTAIVALLVL